MSDARSAAVELRAIAAVAQKLAEDLDHNRLWPGEAAPSLAVIRRALDAAERLVR